MRARRLGIAAGLTAVLAVSGCGSTSKSLSQAQYQQQLGSICTDAQKSLTAVPKPTTPAGLGTYVDKIVNVANNEVNKMVALRPPKAEQAKLNSAVTQAHTTLNQLKTDLGGNPSKETPSELQSAIAKLGPAFDKVGSAFTSAGAPPSCNSTTGSSSSAS